MVCSARSLEPVVLAGLFAMLALLGCQDGLGHETTAEGQLGSTATANASSDQGDGSSNASTDPQTGERDAGSSSGFTPEQEASREEDGAWSDVTQVTIVPYHAFDDVSNNDVPFCRISSQAFSIGIFYIEKVGKFVQMCSKEPYNPYRLAFRTSEVERVKTISGNHYLPTLYLYRSLFPMYRM